MTRTPSREALNHFLAAALIGLALTGLSDVLPLLTERQQALLPRSAEYAALSLLIAAGMALFSYVRSHQGELTEDVAHVLDAEAQAGPSEQR